MLADDLAVLLTERFARPVPAPDQPSAPLPVPLTPIVGREDEIAAVIVLLREPEVRLVTLIGPGGIGKTRLAIEVARRMLAAGGPAGLDGASFIDLAAVREAAGWPDAVMAALGIPPEGTRPVLLGASGHARQVIGTVAWPGMQSTIDDLEATVARALGPDAFAATAVGARLRIPDAFRYGLAATAEQATSDPYPDWASRLRPAGPPVATGRPGL